MLAAGLHIRSILLSVRRRRVPGLPLWARDGWLSHDMKDSLVLRLRTLKLELPSVGGQVVWRLMEG